MSNGNGSLEVIRRFKDTTAHSFVDGELICSSKNKIFKITDLSDPELVEIGRIPWRLSQNISRVRFFDRALKHSILQVLKTSKGGYLISNGSSWWRLSSGTCEAIPEFGQTRPMNRGLCESASGNVYIAQYISNPERGPVSIFRTADLLTFDVAWEFPAQKIRHIHALIRDSEIPQRIWVLTGDEDGESGLFYSDDEFASLESFLMAGQRSRAADLIIRDGRIYWGMDSPDEAAFFMTARRDAPGFYKELFELPGPAYYMATNQAGGIYLGTTVEPGAGVKDNFGHIIRYREGSGHNEVLRCRNDWVPQFGIFYFPSGTLPENYLAFSQRALTPHEGCLTIARDRGL